MSNISKYYKKEVEVKVHKKEKPVSELVNDSLAFSSKNATDPKKIVHLFEAAFSLILFSADLKEHIQTVKGKLFERDYLAAFDNDDKRFAYASRWAPARSLCYSSLFALMEEVVELLGNPDEQINALCVGAGACSELVGLSSVFCRLKETHSTSPSMLNMDVIDIADWSTVVRNLTGHIQKNWIYKEEKLQANFLHQDILDPTVDLKLEQQQLVTLLFTTNELFTEKKKETMKFLQRLSSECQLGTLLLIAESAGSYSHITIGTKKFPVQFLIDMLLCGKPGEVGAWEIVQLSESCWYRIDQREVNYPMKLESMRFFYRLYKKT